MFPPSEKELLMNISGVNPALKNDPAYSLEPAKAPLGEFDGDLHYILADQKNRLCKSSKIYAMITKRCVL